MTTSTAAAASAAEEWNVVRGERRGRGVKGGERWGRLNKKSVTNIDETKIFH